MSSNLFKSYSVKREAEDSRLIDTNDIIEQKLERIRMILPKQSEAVPEDGFYSGLPADSLDLLTGDKAEPEQGEDEFVPSNIIKAQPPQMEEPVYEGPTPEELVEQANQEIAQMREQARQEIEAQKEQVLKEARQTGYEDGLAKGQQEAAALKEALDEEKQKLESSYEEKIDELEPDFIRVLTGIYEKIFEIDFSEDKELIVTLLRNSMKKIEGCKNFLIHVSHEDYPVVSEQKQQLLSDASQEGTTIDVIEDMTLTKNACMIETPGGIFDCSLDTQLSELRKRLTLLSYERNQ